MVKRISITIISLLVTGFAIAQQSQKFRFSVFVNPCINWLSTDVKNVSSSGPVLGYDAGLTIDRFFADRYAFSTGVSIGSLGGKLKYDNSTRFADNNNEMSGGSVMKFKLQYINIPIGLKFKTNEIGYLTYFAHLGFNANINIKAIGESSDQTYANDNISDKIHTLNMGYFFGGGAEYSLGGNTALIVGLTLTNGFLDITTDKNDKITSSSLALRLGILF